LTMRTTVADLAKEMALPVLVVSRPNLGMLNHTLLTLRMLRQYGLSLCGVLINTNRPPGRDKMEHCAIETNPGILRRVAKVSVWGPLPFQRKWQQRRWSSPGLGDWIESCLGEETLRQVIAHPSLISWKGGWS
jgi:dethiobiotin synthetase